MLEHLVMQALGNSTVPASTSFVNVSWDLVVTIMTAFTVISGIAIFWVSKLRNVLKNSKNQHAKEILHILDDYVVPILQQGQEVAEATKNQEIKAKQFGEILYNFMGPAADQIKEKYYVRIQNLSDDVERATKGTEDYNEKVKALMDLIEQMKSEILKK